MGIHKGGRDEVPPGIQHLFSRCRDAGLKRCDGAITTRDVYPAAPIREGGILDDQIEHGRLLSLALKPGCQQGTWVIHGAGCDDQRDD